MTTIKPSQGFLEYLKEATGKTPEEKILNVWQKIAVENKSELQLENRRKFEKLKAETDKNKGR